MKTILYYWNRFLEIISYKTKEVEERKTPKSILETHGARKKIVQYKKHTPPPVPTQNSATTNNAPPAATETSAAVTETSAAATETAATAAAATETAAAAATETAAATTETAAAAAAAAAATAAETSKAAATTEANTKKTDPSLLSKWKKGPDRNSPTYNQDKNIKAESNYIHKITATDESGRKALYYVYIKPEKYKKLQFTMKSNGKVNFEEYGRVLSCCFGETPTVTVQQEMYEKFGIDVNKQ